MAPPVAHSVATATPGEQRLRPGAVPERRMHVERRARRRHRVLRHERDRASLEMSDLLGAVLVQRGAVRHLEGLGVHEVDLFLSPAPLALGRLDGDVRRLHPVADGADERLLLGGLEDVVVLQVARDRGQVRVAFRPGRLEALPEAVQLELRGGLDDVALTGGALDLPAQDPPRRLLDRLPVLRVHVAEHECGLREPRDQAERGHVGDHLHVPVAALPGRQLEPGQRFHLHVDGEEIDAGVDPVLRGVLEEVPGDDALAHQPAEPVGKHGENGVDLAGVDQSRKHVAGDPPGHDGQLAQRHTHDHPDPVGNALYEIGPGEIGTGGISSSSRTRQQTPTTRRPGVSGVRSSRGAPWWKPITKYSSAAQTNQFGDRVISPSPSRATNVKIPSMRCRAPNRAYAIRPPSSWPTGNRFRAVMNSPIQPANPTSWMRTSAPEGSVPKVRYTRKRMRSESPNVHVPTGGIGITVDHRSPSSSAGIAITSPAMGPAAAMSKSELRSLAGDRIRMMAPSVPKNGGGAGMKYGRLTD